MVAAVLVAGALGAIARYALSRAFPSRRGALPGAILIANAVGCALAGIVLGLAERALLSPDFRLILLTGFCGGLTTFSTWTVETVELIHDRRVGVAVLNITVTLAVGITATTAAYLIVR